MNSHGFSTTLRPSNELHAPNRVWPRPPEDDTHVDTNKHAAEDYRHLAQQLNEQAAIQPRDIETTQENIKGIRKKWIRYKVDFFGGGY